MYLNVAEFGYGIYGVEAAARHYFHVPAAQLTRRRARCWPPCCRTRGVCMPIRRRAYVLAQRDRILQQMANLGGAAYLRTIEPAEARAR